ncbi:hypothetical protein UlMin_007633 [Ulmus minor]
MDLIHTFMNIALPPITLILLICALPPLLVFKLTTSIKRSISGENLAGKVVLITGAGSGIGEQIAYEYARKGALLALVDIKEDNLVTVSNNARSLGSSDVITIAADVSKVEDCKRLIDETVNHFWRLDHLVTNAGILRHSGFKDVASLNSDLLHPVMNVNFWGAVYTIHSAIPHLRRTKGKIVAISSTCGWYPLPTLSIYNASKAALINFCETLRTELGNSIGVTIVTPGVIETKMTTEDQDFFKVIPAVSAERCGKAIVRSARRGDLYLTEPCWVRTMFPIKLIIPLIVEWGNRRVFKLNRTKLQ